MSIRDELLDGIDKKYSDMLEGTTPSPFQAKCTLTSPAKYKKNKAALESRIKSERSAISAATKRLKDGAKMQEAVERNERVRQYMANSVFKRNILISLAIAFGLALYALVVFSDSAMSLARSFIQEASMDYYVPVEGDGVIPCLIAALMVLTAWVVYWVIAIKKDEWIMIGYFFGAFFVGGAPLTFLYALSRLLVWGLSYLCALILNPWGFLAVMIAGGIAVILFSYNYLFSRLQMGAIKVIGLMLCLAGLLGYWEVKDHFNARLDYTTSHDGTAYSSAAEIDGEGFYRVYLNEVTHKEGHYWFVYTAEESGSCEISTTQLSSKPRTLTVYDSIGVGELRELATGPEEETGVLTVDFEAEKTYYIRVTTTSDDGEPRYGGCLLVFNPAG